MSDVCPCLALSLSPYLCIVETPNNGPLLLSPPHNNSLVQRENMQVTQPCSAPSSPLASPGALSSTSFTMPGGSSSSSSSASGAASTAAAAAAGGASAASSALHALSLSTGAGSSAYSPALLSAAVTTSSASSTSSNTNSSAALLHQQQHQFFVNAAAIDTGDPNWQATKATVRERNAAMFNNDLMADITFVVGGIDDNVQTIPAHKYVLATGSSVFYAMFFGGLADTKLEVKVPDVEPMAFLTLLK